MAEEMNYAGAGVSIEDGNELVRRIAPFVKSTYTPRVVGGLGSFAGLFSLDYNTRTLMRLFRRGYKNPVLVAATDGVGTKLEIARLAGKHDTIGIDLVAMCVNDLIVCGAEPLFFLDYFVTGKLNVDVTADVIKGIAEGCNQASSALLGGETAEHPGTMDDTQYDLAGFAVGVVEKKRIIDGSRVEAGDVVLGVASNGVHSNGFSLIRKIVFEKAGLTVDSHVDELGMSVADALLVPTRIYVKAVSRALAGYRVKRVIKAIAHITGGGIVENVPRVLPAGISVEMKKGSWPVPPVFDWLERTGEIDPAEMHRVFNMGLGMVLVVSPYYADAVARSIEGAGEKVFRIGETVSTRDESRVIFKNESKS